MRRRISAIAVIAVALGLAGGSVPARATHACASYSVTAPGLGTEEDTECSPVPLPDWFEGYLRHTECQGSPPVGFEMCAGFELHGWLP